jgi:magnesium transporter
MRTDEQTLLDRLRALATLEVVDLRSELEGIRTEDLAEAFLRLEPDEQLSLLRGLDADVAGDLLVELPTETTRRLADELPDEVLAHYLDVLPMDDALDLSEEIEPERFDALLNVIPEEDAEEIRRLLSFPEGTVGRLLTEDFVIVAPDTAMGDVLDLLRSASSEEFETINYLYVLSEDRHLLGLLTLRRVLRAKPDDVARDVMNPDPITVEGSLGQEEAARLLARYGFSALPVLDQRGRMLGIFTADDAQEVLSDADTEDVLKLGAVSGDAESYLSLSAVQLVRRRLPWLFMLFFAETFTGFVLRHYIPTETHASGVGQLAIIASLTLFIPLLIGAGGNSGSQVTTTITRALAVGDVKPTDAWRILRREFTVAVIIGLTLGTAGFLRALSWKSGLNVSMVVGMALPLIVLWAATVGSMLPLVAKRFGIDPAVMSAPFIATFVDATGLIIYFEVARQVLGLTYR